MSEEEKSRRLYTGFYRFSLWQAYQNRQRAAILSAVSRQECCSFFAETESYSRFLLLTLPLTLRELSAVKFRVVGVEILVVQIVLDQAHAFTEALEVGQLALPQEADRIPHVGVVAEAQNVIVGGARLLLCCNHKCTTFFERCQKSQ